jgi:hypothetical protein
VQRANRAIAASWRKRLGPVRSRAIDVGLAVVVAVAVMIAIGVSGYSDPGTRPPDALAYALGATIGALLLARRRWPVGVLVASVVTLHVVGGDQAGHERGPRRAGRVRVATGGYRGGRARPEVYGRRTRLARGGRPDLPSDRFDERPASGDGPGGLQTVGSNSQAPGAKARRAMSGANQEIHNPARYR